MPTPEEILQGLAHIANVGRPLALAWHAYFAAIAVTFFLGIRPSGRLMGVLLSLPLFSVSVLAALASNPFNAGVFAVAGAALLLLSIRLPRTPVARGPAWAVAAGALMFLFGWVYPHFLEGPWWVYLHSAPTGLIPCPTLSIVTGVALVTGGLGARAWPLTLAAAGLFYGIFGALRLGVSLDWALVAGAVALAWLAIRPAIDYASRKARREP